MRKIDFNPLSISLLIIAVTLFFSCSKNPLCWGKNKNKGIIQSSVRINCEPFSDQKEFAITNDFEFQQIFSDTLLGETDCILPVIDFDSLSVLGLFADGGCEIKFIREVFLKESENKYYYKVVVRDCGTCKKYGYSYNWVTVPRIPDGWTVTFEIVENNN